MIAVYQDEYKINFISARVHAEGFAISYYQNHSLQLVHDTQLYVQSYLLKFFERRQRNGSVAANVNLFTTIMKFGTAIHVPLRMNSNLPSKLHFMFGVH